MVMEFPDISPQEPVIIETDIDWEITEKSIDWEDDDVMTLPDGVKSKVLNRNEAEDRVDMIHQFPPGYIEPEHTHEAAHAVLILEGRMLVHGHELTPGDYIYGQKLAHGPMEYPDGCTVFASFVGGSAAHKWDTDPNE